MKNSGLLCTFPQPCSFPSFSRGTYDLKFVDELLTYASVNNDSIFICTFKNHINVSILCTSSATCCFHSALFLRPIYIVPIDSIH